MTNLMTLLVGLIAAGVPVIDNSTEPVNREAPIVFEEIFRFGADVDDPNLFWAAETTSVELDHTGRMAVVDTAENRILVFDETGSFVRQVGRPGEGPGEFSHLDSLQFLANGEAVAFEIAPGSLPVLTWFDAELNHRETQRTTNLSRIPFQVRFSPDLRYIAGGYAVLGISSGEMAVVTGVLNRDLEPVVELSRTVQGFEAGRMTEPGYLSGFIAETVSQTYTSAAFVHFDSEGRLYTALGNRYEITRHNADLKPELVITRRFERKPLNEETRELLAEDGADQWRTGPMAPMITSDLVRRVREKLELPAFSNPVQGLLTTDDGLLLVVHEIDRTTGRQAADLYDAKGTYLGQASLPGWAFVGPDGRARMRFGDGVATTIETDEEGDNRVVRYRVRRR